MTDDFTRRAITRSLDTDHQQLVQDAERIQAALAGYIDNLKRNPSTATYSGEAVRIGTYLIQHAQAAARYDGARDMARTLLGDEAR